MADNTHEFDFAQKKEPHSIFLSPCTYKNACIHMQRGSGVAVIILIAFALPINYNTHK